MLFKNIEIQAELEENGYVVVPFLNPLEVENLNSFYNSIHTADEPPNFYENIHMTSWCSDNTYKQKISSGLTQLFEEASNKCFENVRRLNHVFIVKRRGTDTNFKVHQDWNVIDESKYQSANVWVALHDVDKFSGALWVLKRSHKINRRVRGAGYLFPEYGDYTKILEQNAVSVKLKAGEAIVFYHSVIHGSPPNLSKKNREAACFTIIPKVAPLCIYFQQKKGDPLQQHEPEDDFMFKYNQLRVESTQIAPSAKPVKLLPSYVNHKVDLKELEIFLQQS